MEEKHRVRMALAAYNAGPKTIIDARKKAKKMGYKIVDATCPMVKEIHNIAKNQELRNL